MPSEIPSQGAKACPVERHGHYVVFMFCGNAFLHHQVRNMVGALVWVGLGRRPSEWVGEVLASRDRRQGAATFAPDGLYLVDVRYDAEWNLPGFDNRTLPFP